MPLLTVLDTPPTFVTEAEYAALSSSTPSSFAEIPTVARYVEDGIRVVFEPVSSVSKFCNSALGPELQEKLKNGTGTWNLLVLESELTFFSPDSSVNGTGPSASSTTSTTASGIGFSVPYPRITLHAISRSSESSAFGPCVYCQLDASSPPSSDAEAEAGAIGGAEVGLGTVIEVGATNGIRGEDDEDDDEEEEEEGEEEDEEELVELRIIPKDSSTLDQIFEALSQCASLHPDPSSPSSEANGFDIDLEGMSMGMTGMGMGMMGDDDIDDLDDAYVDADVEAVQEIVNTEGVENEDGEVGKVLSDYVNDSRYKPY